MVEGFLTETGTEVGQWRSYFDHQFAAQPQSPGPRRWQRPGPAVTISAQTGAGAHEVASLLASILQSAEPPGSPPWTTFDRQLVEKVLAENQLPVRLAALMPEDRRTYLDDLLDDMMGLRPPSWEIIPKIIKMVLHLADVGHVILIGRGAGFITGQLPNVLHVRLIAALPNRIKRVQKQENLPAEEAEKLITRTDRGRGRYLKSHFHARPDDDLLYHLVLNTDRMPPSAVAELIAEAAVRCFRSSAEAG
jgi:cytidylate kinase